MLGPQAAQQTTAAGETAAATPQDGGWAQRIWGSRIFDELTVADLVLILAVVALAWILSVLVRAALTRAFQRRAPSDQGSQLVVKRLLHYVIMSVGFFLALNLAGFSLTSLFAAGAVFAVVIGFALQNLSENFVAGVILMVERSITPGDVLEVEGRVVRVIRMGIRATVARTRDDEDLIVPNSLLVTTTVKNYTLHDSLYRVRASVGVAYSSDIAKVRGVLESCARSFAGRHASKDPRVLLTEFAANAVKFEVSIWIEDPWHSAWLLSQLNEAVWSALKSAEIAIAFPQLDLHLDPEVLKALGARGAPGSEAGPSDPAH